MKNYLYDFLKKCEYSESDIAFLTATYEAIASHPEASALWEQAIALYREKIHCDFKKILSLANRAAEILSIQAQAGIAQDGVWGPQTAAAYDSGIRPKNDTPVPTRNFEWVTQQADNYVSAGASKSEISSFLIQALQAGYITQAQYTSLKALFVPRGLTY